MLEDWFKTMEVAMSLEDWHRLPRNGGYKYEYIDGMAQITPEPRCCDVGLELGKFRRPVADEWERWDVRALLPGDWEELAGVMAAAFSGVAPFATFSGEELDGVMKDCVQHTRQGGDGELLLGACLGVWHGSGEEREPELMGAALVTLRPGETTGGAATPLLAWIFVSPWMKRRGGGGVLLARVVEKLREMGYAQLESVVCTGNHASMTWHWHRGFVMGPTVRERVRERFRERR